MRKFLLLTTLAAAATVAAGITAQAQTYSPGMMGNDQTTVITAAMARATA